MSREISEEEQNKIKSMIDELIEKAKKASEEYLKLSQEDVDRIVKAMSMAGLEHHMELAKMAVEETRRGIYEDKITKNMFIIVLNMIKLLELFLKMKKRDMLK